jgi:hypothetical protein
VQVNAFVLQLYGVLRDSILGEAFVSHTGDLHACVDVNLARILVRMERGTGCQIMKTFFVPIYEHCEIVLSGSKNL